MQLDRNVSLQVLEQVKFSLQLQKLDKDEMV